MAVTFGFMPTALGAVRYYVADTAAELPTVAPAAEGDFGYAKDTDLTYRYGGVSWVAQVLTTDSRLTDARVPTAHAASHASAGSDPVTLAQSQVTNLTTDLAAKQPLDATLTALAGLTIAADSLSIGTGADAFTQVSFAANTFPAKSSSGALVAKTLTDFALTILDDADGPAVRTTIGAGTSSVTLPIAISDTTGLQTALDAKAPSANPVFTGTVTIPDNALAIADTSGLQTALDGKQPLDTDLTAIAALVSAADKMPYATGAGTWSLADLSVFARTFLDDTTAAAVRATLEITAGGDLSLTKIAPAADVTVTAGYSAYVSPYYEFSQGVTTEIGAGSNLEIG